MTDDEFEVEGDFDVDIEDDTDIYQLDLDGSEEDEEVDD